MSDEYMSDEYPTVRELGRAARERGDCLEEGIHFDNMYGLEELREYAEGYYGNERKVRHVSRTWDGIKVFSSPRFSHYGALIARGVFEPLYLTEKLRAVPVEEYAMRSYDSVEKTTTKKDVYVGVSIFFDILRLGAYTIGGGYAVHYLLSQWL